MNAFRRINIVLGGVVALLLLSIVQRFWPEGDPADVAEPAASAARGQSASALGDNRSTETLRSPPRRPPNANTQASSLSAQAGANLASRNSDSTSANSPSSPLDRAATGFQGIEITDDADDYEESPLSSYPSLDERGTRRSRITSG